MKKKIIFIFSLGLFLISVLQILVNVFPGIEKRNLIDFTVYYGALDKFANGKDPYHYLYGPSVTIPFNYPPSSLIILIPFKLLPLKLSQQVLTILSFISLWLSLWIIVKMSKIKISLSHFLIILAFFNQTFPVKFTLILGQINLIVLGLAFSGLYFYHKQKTIGVATGWVPTALPVGRQARSDNPLRNEHWREGKSGQNLSFFISLLLLSLSSSLKIFPLFVLPLFLILKDFRFVILSASIFLGFNIFASFQLASEYYLQIVPNISKIISKPDFYDQSLLAFFLRLGIDPSIAKVVALIIIIGIYIMILYRCYKNHINFLLSFALVFSLLSIGSLFSWQHHLIFSYPLILLVYLNLWLRRKKLGWRFYLIAFMLWGTLAFHFTNQSSIFLKNPFFASYQTILIVVIISYAASFETKAVSL